MASRALEIIITGDPSKFHRAIGDVEKDVSRAEGRLHKFGKIAGAAFLGAGAAAGGALVVGLKKSADAAIEAEKSQSRMTAQLKASGINYQAHRKEIDRVIQAHSKLSGLDDEDLQDSFTNIVRVTGNVNKALKLNGLAADIARAKHIDVAKAGQIVAKAYDGNVGALKRYGVSVEPVTKAQDRLKESHKKYTAEQLAAAKQDDKRASAQEALARAQKTFGGQAEAYGKTTAGAMDRAKVALENLGEVVGAKLSPFIARAAIAFTDLIDKSGQLSGPIRTVTGVLRDAWDRAGEAIRRFRTRNAEDIQAVVDAVRNYGRFVKRVIENVILPAVRIVLPAFKGMVEGILQVLRGLVRIVTGIINGDWSRVWDGFKDIFKGAFKAVVSDIKGLGRLILAGIKAAVPLVLGAAKAVGKAIVNGIVAGIKAAPGAIGGAIKGAVGGALKGVGSFLGIGDGIGRVVRGARSQLPQGGAFGGSLQGARPELRPIAALGAQFGLTVSSGRREGAITSSGNTSWHSSGEALDEAGSPAGMLRFFNYMKSNFGGRLAELIYTPGGSGIKNGQPFTYTGSVAADHYDHVHVAMDVGRPGIGDGIGEATAAARAAGFRGQNLVNMVAIAGAESGYNPRRQNLTPPDHSIGLWQINQLAHHGRFGSDAALMNPVTNARAAAALFRESGYAPWTTWPSAARGFIAKARAAVTGTRKAGSLSSSAGIQARTIENPVGNLGIVSGGWSGGPGPRGGIPNAFGSTGLIADVTAATNLAVARFGGDERANPARREQIAAIRARMQKIRHDLQKPGMSRGVRLRLTNELAELITTARQLGDDISASIPTPPTPADFAENRIAQAGLTADLGDDLAAAQNMLGVRGTELARARRTGDPTKIADAVNAFKAASDAVDDLKKQIEPTADDFDRMHQAQAALTDTLEDDLDVAKGVAARRLQEYQAALATGDPRKIADAAEAFKQATDAVNGFTDAIAQATPTARDRNDLAQAMAALTDTLDDDIQAARDRVAIDEEALKQAQNTPDIRDDIEAATNLKGSRDQLKSLEDAIRQDTEQRQQEEEARKALIQAQTDALKGVQDELKRSNDIATTTTASEVFQIKKWIADVASAQVGARVRGRAFTPGSGSAVAY